jgi:tryptophanyl-tRNA synthetase
MKKLVSGIKPTGELTLGSYIGAVKQYIELQKEYDSCFFVADLHAITKYQDPKELREKTKKIVALYLACGLDPKQATIYLQSENPYHSHLSWILSCNAYLGELNRMTQYKDQKIKDSNLSVGFYTYPVLMAADIVMYDAEYVPVGEDQVQHVELARDIVQRFNKRYGNKLIMPEPIVPKIGARIKDLQEPTKKMSKSDGECKGSILLLDDEKIVRKKVMSAITDSDNLVKYDVKNKPGISNLITIYSSLSDLSIKEVETEFIDKNYGEFKTAVADKIVEVLKPIQDKYYEYINSDMIDEVLDQGIKKVTVIAQKKCELIAKAVGLGRQKC